MNRSPLVLVAIAAALVIALGIVGYAALQLARSANLFDAASHAPEPTDSAVDPDAEQRADSTNAPSGPARRAVQPQPPGGVPSEPTTAPADGGRPSGEAAAPAGARGSVLVDDASRSAPDAAAAGTASTLDKEAVRRGIQAAAPKIKACYESALKVQPELMGRIVVEFKIEATPDAGGAVTSGEVVDTDVASPFFEACVLKEVAGTAFEAPSGAGVVTVRYPFQFQSDAQP